MHAVFMCILFHSLCCYSIDTQCVYVSVYIIKWCPPLTSSCSVTLPLSHSLTWHAIGYGKKTHSWELRDPDLSSFSPVDHTLTHTHTDTHIHLTIGLVILGKDGKTQVTEKQWTLWYCFFQPNEHTCNSIDTQTCTCFCAVFAYQERVLVVVESHEGFTR